MPLLVLLLPAVARAYDNGLGRLPPPQTGCRRKRGALYHPALE